MTTTTHPCDRRVPPSGLMRWCRFNLVGGIGILVQFAVLVLLKSVMQFNYLASTVIAVEAAVLHNFVWHERFTWADRTKAALKRCATQKPSGATFRRLLRFHLGNGAVSIFGNLALMKLMVGLGTNELSARERDCNCSVLGREFSGERGSGCSGGSRTSCSEGAATCSPDLQHDLAVVFSVLEEFVGFGGTVEREDVADLRR